MAIREKLNANRWLGVGVAAVLVIGGVAAIVYQVAQSAGPGIPAAPQAFFSSDDGKTWFSDNVDKVPPFMHDGKEAVRAYVFEAGGRKFVGYLERYRPEARKVLEAVRAPTKPGAPPVNFAAMQQAEATGREVKRPGDKQWVPLRSGPGAKVTQIEAQGGAEASAVEP